MNLLLLRRLHSLSPPVRDFVVVELPGLHPPHREGWREADVVSHADSSLFSHFPLPVYREKNNVFN